MAHFYILEKWNSFEKVVGMCFFGPAPRSFIPPEDVLAAVSAVTGWDFSMEEALSIGERATNMARVFNTREGFSRKDDALPERLFQPLETGALAGQAMPREEFEQALTILYALKGWKTDTGHPTRERLEALSLGWATGLMKTK
jgi:aldehyde:ferredoxin oxidoreductase